MRKISSKSITDAVEKLCADAAFNLPSDVYSALKISKKKESGLAKTILSECVENADIAKKTLVPICQDTGIATVFVELGDKVEIEGSENLFEVIQAGVKAGYEKYYLRKSIVSDPLFDRKNTGDNTPAIIHFDLVKGDSLKIILAPKGGGSENCSALKMLKPSDGEEGVIDFVVNSVVSAGGNPCPPVIVGVGIGGTADKCLLSAKKALLREIDVQNVGAGFARPKTTNEKNVYNTHPDLQNVGAKHLSPNRAK